MLDYFKEHMLFDLNYAIDAFKKSVSYVLECLEYSAALN